MSAWMDLTTSAALTLDPGAGYFGFTFLHWAEVAEKIFQPDVRCCMRISFVRTCYLLASLPWSWALCYCFPVSELTLCFLVILGFLWCFSVFLALWQCLMFPVVYSFVSCFILIVSALCDCVRLLSVSPVLPFALVGWSACVHSPPMCSLPPFGSP